MMSGMMKTTWQQTSITSTRFIAFDMTQKAFGTLNPEDIMMMESWKVRKGAWINPGRFSSADYASLQPQNHRIVQIRHSSDIKGAKPITVDPVAII